MTDSDDPTDPMSAEELRAEMFRAVCARAGDSNVRARIEAAVMELRLQDGVGMQPMDSVRSADPVLELLLRVLGLGDEGDAVGDALERPLTESQQRAAWVASRPIERPSSPPENENLPNYMLGEVVRQKEATVIGWQPTDEDLTSFIEEQSESAQEDLAPRQPSTESLTGLVAFDGSDAMERSLDRARERIGQVYKEGSENPHVIEEEGTARPASKGASTEEEADDPTEDLASFHALLAASVADTDEWEDREEPEPMTPASSPGASQESQQTKEPGATGGVKTSSRRADLFAAADHALNPSAPLTPPIPSDPRGRPAIRPNPSHVRASLQVSQWMVFSVVAAGVVLGMVVLGIVLGASQVNKAYDKASQERDEMYALILKKDGLLGQIRVQGGQTDELEAVHEAYLAADEPQRARRALHLVNQYAIGMVDLRSAGSTYRQVQSEVKSLERAKNDYELALRFWAKKAGGLLGSVAIFGGLAEAPDQMVLVPLE